MDDSVIAATLICNDDSYQGAPDHDFENSRAEGVELFARAANIDGPSDFSFLMTSGLDKAASDSPRGSPVGTPPVCMSPMAMDQSPIEGPAQKRAKSKQTSVVPVPPRPAQRPKAMLFGRSEDGERGEKAMWPPAVRHDVFAWFRDDTREDPEVMKLLQDEDAYAVAALQHLAGLREMLYQEMRGHLHEGDAGLPIRYPGGYTYEYRMFDGKPYSAHYRRQVLEVGSLGPEELVIDNNELAIDPADSSQRPYCNVRDPRNDPSHSLYAYAVDFRGDDAFEMRVKCAQGSNVHVPHVAIPNTDGTVEWGINSDCFYYVSLDAEYRSATLKKHTLGQSFDGASDVTLWHESDKTMSVELSKTSCGRYIVSRSASAETTEVLLLDLENPGSGLHRIAPRLFGHRYSVQHRGGWLYILTNKDGAHDSKLCRVPVSSLPDVATSAWEDVWVPEEGSTIESHQCFQDFIALGGRQHGAPAIFVCGYDDAMSWHKLIFPEVEAHSGRVHTPRGMAAASAAFYAWIGNNACFESEMIRYHYTSFTVPEQWYDYHVPTKRHQLLKQNKVPFF
jgi:oligopeptidase B